MSPKSNELKQALERTQAALAQTLDEACEKDVAEESTGELIRLEELLNEAATSAKEAISLRRRLGAERARGVPLAREDADATRRADDQPSEEGEKIREFRDARGTLWRVWEVPPEQLDRSRPGAYAGEFESGWLCFEDADGSERRRLPSYPSDWSSLTNADLESLNAQAKPVTRKRRGQGNSSDERDPGTP
jgi:hypothetical protein